jgi:hypothetical protein
MSITITSDYMSTAAYAANNVQPVSASSKVASATQSSTGSVHNDSVQISPAGQAAAGGGAQTSSASTPQTEIQKIEKMIAKIQQELAALMQKDDEQSKQLIASKTTQLAAYQAELMVLNIQNTSTSSQKA